MLTTEAARTLLPIVIERVGDIPIEFHAHCNNGMARYCAIIAVEARIDIVHTAISPLAGGSSQPSVFSVAQNLRAKGFTPMIDTAPLERVKDHFSRVADEEGLPKGVPAEYEERFYHHQVPGG